MKLDDDKVIQSSTLLLTSFIRIGSEHMMQVRVDNVPILQILCQAVHKLLDPEIKDTMNPYIGGMITQLISKMSNELGQNLILQVIKAVIVRLHSAEFPSLIENLLLVFARLVHIQGDEFLNFLQQFGVLQIKIKVQKKLSPEDLKVPYPKIQYVYQDGQANAMELILRKWVTGA